MSEAGFSAFGTQHFVALTLTAAMVVAMFQVEKSERHAPLAKGCRLALAGLMILIFPLSLVADGIAGIAVHASGSLPMHLCDWAAITAFVALVWRKPLFAELTYFWGLAGTLQGLATPDIEHGFPHPLFLVFFLLHGGVVVAALYLVFGLGLRPRRGAVWRIFLWTQFYVVVAGVTNAILGTNYGYLRAKPVKASLLDFMGEWPWYILVLEVACLVLFLLLDLPFAPGRRRAGAKS